MRGSIQLARRPPAFHPAEHVQGTLSWSMGETPPPCELRLLWETAGKGTREVVVVARERLRDMQPAETRSFDFTLPAMPYSYQGVYLAILWSVRAVIPNRFLDRLSEVIASVDIVVSPSLEPVRPPRR